MVPHTLAAGRLKGNCTDLSLLCVQTYLSMLCSMRWGLFFFFAGMCVIMTITVYLFYPETKGLGIEETPNVFKKHWCAHLQLSNCVPSNHVMIA